MTMEAKRRARQDLTEALQALMLLAQADDVIGGITKDPQGARAKAELVSEVQTALLAFNQTA